jgi:hypothetical protein
MKRIDGLGGSSAARSSKLDDAPLPAALDLGHSPRGLDGHQQPLVIGRRIAAIDIGIVIGIVVAAVVVIEIAAAEAEMPSAIEMIVRPGKVLTSQTAADARTHMDAA